MVMPPFSLTVPADHVDNVFGQPVRYSGRIAQQSHGRNTYIYDTFNIVAGLRGDFEDVAEFTMFEDWQWDLFSTYGVSTIQSSIPENLREPLQDALNSCSDANELSNCFNPFYSSELGTGTPNSGPVLARIQGEHGTMRLSGLRTHDASINGTLFDLPGGPVGMALGGQVRWEWATANVNHDAEVNRLGLVIGGKDYSVERDVFAGYLELRLPAYDGVELQAAARVERHTDIERTATNPTVGVTVVPARIAGEDGVVEWLRRLTLRGHFARGRAAWQCKPWLRVARHAQTSARPKRKRAAKSPNPARMGT